MQASRLCCIPRPQRETAAGKQREALVASLPYAYFCPAALRISRARAGHQHAFQFRVKLRTCERAQHPSAVPASNPLSTPTSARASDNINTTMIPNSRSWVKAHGTLTICNSCFPQASAARIDAIQCMRQWHPYCCVWSQHGAGTRLGCGGTLTPLMLYVQAKSFIALT